MTLKNNETKKETKTKKVKQSDKEAEIEKEISDIIDTKTSYNFLINATNQANLTNTYNASPTQANALFVLVSPYHVENFNLEGLDLKIKINEDGSVLLNDEVFNTLEIKPGIKIFGISFGK